MKPIVEEQSPGTGNHCWSLDFVSKYLFLHLGFSEKEDGSRERKWFLRNAEWLLGSFRVTQAVVVGISLGVGGISSDRVSWCLSYCWLNRVESVGQLTIHLLQTPKKLFPPACLGLTVILGWPVFPSTCCSRSLGESEVCSPKEDLTRKDYEV